MTDKNSPVLATTPSRLAAARRKASRRRLLTLSFTFFGIGFASTLVLGPLGLMRVDMPVLIITLYLAGMVLIPLALVLGIISAVGMVRYPDDDDDSGKHQEEDSQARGVNAPSSRGYTSDSSVHPSDHDLNPVDAESRTANKGTNTNI